MQSTAYTSLFQDDAPLSAGERRALQMAAEAFKQIRMLATSSVTPETLRTIFDLADAMHNVPEQAAAHVSQRTANAWLIETGMQQAIAAFQSHGLRTPAVFNDSAA